MNLNPYDIIRKPRMTEKSVYLQNDHGKYTFEVPCEGQQGAGEGRRRKFFDVKVQTVRTINRAGKARRTRWVLARTAAWKKAIVTLADGQQIEGGLSPWPCASSSPSPTVPVTPPCRTSPRSPRPRQRS